MNRPDQTSFCCSGGWGKVLFSSCLNFHIESWYGKVFLLDMNKNAEKEEGEMKFKFFTIVELLIVIAILAILVAVLMPALSKARSKAHQITCIGNCKSILLSLHSYSGDENEWIPPIITNSSDSSTYWIYKLERYGLKRKISRCPAQMNETYHFDYSANSYVAGRDASGEEGLMHRLLVFKFPSTAIFAGDGQAVPTNTINRFFYRHGGPDPDAPNRTWKSDNQLIPRSNANFMFLDGHAASKRRIDFPMHASSSLSITKGWDPTTGGISYPSLPGVAILDVYRD